MVAADIVTKLLESQMESILTFAVHGSPFTVRGSRFTVQRFTVHVRERRDHRTAPGHPFASKRQTPKRQTPNAEPRTVNGER
jgi:hypothetical protein